MTSKSPVELADHVSRKRAVLVAVAAIVFLAHAVLRPLLGGGLDAAQGARTDLWAINALLLLAVLATGGFLFNRRRVRALVNDEVSRAHYRTAVAAGYWVAMATAMAVFLLPPSRGLAARAAVYVIVSASLVVALLVFSWLEHRAHRDA